MMNVRTIHYDYEVVESDDLIVCHGDRPITVTLPKATRGKEITIRRVGEGNVTIVVPAESTEVLD